MGTYGVTGSASGLGAAVTRRLRSDGHEVIGVDLADAEVVADLATPEGRTAAVEGVIKAAGDGLAGFVACAGIGPESPSDLMVGVNYFGAVASLAGVLPFIDREGSAVAFCSNSVGLTTIDDHTSIEAMLSGDEAAACAALRDQPGPISYAMTKLGLGTWVRSQVIAWGQHGVRLNAVAPGPIETPLLQASRDDPVFGEFVDALPIPLGRTGQPDEIAGVVAFLLGPDASYVHGSIVFCDAGIDADARPHHV